LFSLFKSTGDLRLPNARGEPLPEAEAQRTLEAVGSSAMLGPVSMFDGWRNGS